MRPGAAAEGLGDGREGLETWADRMFPDRQEGLALLKRKRKTLNQNKAGLHLDKYAGLWLLRETVPNFYSFYSGSGPLL